MRKAFGSCGVSLIIKRNSIKYGNPLHKKFLANTHSDVPPD